MTPSELKYNVEKTGSYFFSRDAMKFFGDTMKNYGCRSAVVRTNWDENDNYVDGEGVTVDCWCLYRKRPVKCGMQSSAYFRKDNHEHITSCEEV